METDSSASNTKDAKNRRFLKMRSSCISCSILFLLLFSFILKAEIRLIGADKPSGLELWETLLGRLWIPSPGAAVMKHLEWEQSVQKVYEHPSVHVLPGDVVLDCGAHIGGFTRTALNSRAGLVVAIEPERLNISAFQRNFPDELKSGKVKLIEKAISDKPGRLALELSTSGDSHSLFLPQNSGKEETVEVSTIDALVANGTIPRIDFIKLDVEGAECKALQGARRAIKKWRPRLAVSSYHQKGDPAAICALLWSIRPDYLVVSKDLLSEPDQIKVPKVLFFY
jgi:FkbM family methyltransferase